MGDLHHREIVRWPVGELSAGEYHALVTRFVRTLVTTLCLYEMLWIGLWGVWWFLLRSDPHNPPSFSRSVGDSWPISQVLLVPLVALALITELVDGAEYAVHRNPRTLSVFWIVLALVVAAWVYITGAWFALADVFGGDEARADWYTTVVLTAQAIPLALVTRNLLRGRLGRVPPAAFAATIVVAFWVYFTA